MPLAVDRTELTFTFHFHQDLADEEKQEFLAFVRQLTKEDMDVCVDIQKNLEGGIFKQGYLTPKRENGVQFFHRLVDSSMEHAH